MRLQSKTTMSNASLTLVSVLLMAAATLSVATYAQDSSSTGYPIITADPALICSEIYFMDARGTLKQGTKSCQATPDLCTTDGQINCVAHAQFKAADMNQAVSANIKAGISIAGRAGTFAGAENCAADGEIGCIAQATYPAADMSNVIAGNIRSGVTIAGIIGMYPSLSAPLAGATATADLISLSATTPSGTYEFFDSAGNRYTGAISDAGTITPGSSDQNFNTSIYRGFTVSGDSDLTAGNIINGVTIFGVAGSGTAESHANCATDGAVGCVANISYKAADMAIATAGNIRNSVTIANVNGDFPSTTYPLSGASGTSDLVSLGASTAAGNYEFWDSAGTRYTGSISDAGTVTPSSSNQTFNTSLYRTFIVAGSANLTAAQIKTGVSIFGVTGDYPSAVNTLNGADATADLTLATFDAQIKSASNFEWFDSTGARYVNTGDTDIAANKIAQGVTIFGTTGTFGVACSGDAEVGCTANAPYKAINTNALTAWDLRAGKTVAGINGQLTFYKNMANTTLFNRTAGTAGAGGLDVYDTIDDQNNGGAFPTQNNTGWDQNTGANFIRDSLSDNGSGGGTSGDGICNGTEECVYKDRITELLWARDSGTNRLWEASITYCDGLTYGGYSDWRLGTQKEMHQLYVDGVWVLKSASQLNLVDDYWSATTVANGTTKGWLTSLSYGTSLDYAKTSGSFSALCVRP